MATAAGLPDKKEIRAGLVLFGGVSLAVYIYGVVYEFLRAIRGSRGLEENPYNAFQKSRIKFTVDIISGASAGGINGVFLAKAICRDLSSDAFKRIKTIWEDAADFSALLKPGRKEMAGLFNEQFFEEQLSLVFDDMDKQAPKVDKSDKAKVMATALDLFVVSTDLNGYVLSGPELGETLFGKPIEAKEYRRLHHLKYRTIYPYKPLTSRKIETEGGYIQDDFLADNNEVLMKLCRATSAYPAALRPVKVTRDNGVGKVMLNPPGKGIKQAYLMDGGVLDNKPFSETIATIFKRAPSGKVDRVLFYVEPDPDTFYNSNVSEPDEPGFWEVAMKAVVGIPSHESITRDFQDIKNRNLRIEKFTEAFNKMEKFINEAWKSNKKLFLNSKYKKYRKFLEQQPAYQNYADLKMNRLICRLRDTCLARALDMNEQDNDTREKVNKAFVNTFKALPDRKPVEDILRVFDVQYRIRRYYRMYEILELLYNDKSLNDNDRKKLEGISGELWSCLNAADEIDWNTWNSDAGKKNAWFAGSLNTIKKNMKDMDQSTLEGEFGKLLDSMFQPVDGFQGIPKEFDQLSERGKKLAKYIDDTVKKMKLKDNPLAGFPPFVEIYVSFELRDMYIYPMEFISDLGERDKIGVVRISPLDAKYIVLDSSKKITGDTLAHFGDFVKKEWRKNDIMWGRLDAAEILIKTFCDINECTDDEKNRLTREALVEIMREELKNQPGIKGDTFEDYAEYLQEKNAGKESLKNVEPEIAFPLLLDVIKSLKGMLKYDLNRQQEKGKIVNKLLGFIDKWLGRIFNILSIPAELIIGAMFEKTPLMLKIYRYLVMILGLWGTITLALYIVGRVLNVGWLNISWQLACIAGAAIVLSSICAWVARRRKPKQPEGKTPPKQK